MLYFMLRLTAQIQKLVLSSLIPINPIIIWHPNRSKLVDTAGIIIVWIEAELIDNWVGHENKAIYTIINITDSGKTD